MAGIVAFYYVGRRSDSLAADGMMDYELMIEVGAGFREWFKLHRRESYNYPPMSMSVETFVPEGSMHPDSLRIAMLLWASSLFKNCPSYNLVKQDLESAGTKFIDFCTGDGVPAHFHDLLEESRNVDISDEVAIYGNSLYTVTMDDQYAWERF